MKLELPEAESKAISKLFDELDQAEADDFAYDDQSAMLRMNNIVITCQLKDYTYKLTETGRSKADDINEQDYFIYQQIADDGTITTNLLTLRYIAKYYKMLPRMY